MRTRSEYAKHINDLCVRPKAFLTIFGDSRNRPSFARAHPKTPYEGLRYPQALSRYSQNPADHKIVIAPPKTEAKHEAKAKAIEAKPRQAESKNPSKINGEEN
jgi:hypothetical protein